MMLSPKDVRKIASTIPNCREMKSKGHSDSDVLSFLLMDESGEPARIQVYCQTGTIGTCRVLNNEVREIFERKCNLRQVLECFSQPSQLPNVDQDMFQFKKEQEEREPKNDVFIDDDEEKKLEDMDMASLKHDEQMVELGLSILAGEFDNLMTNFKYLLRERQRNEEAMEKLEEQNNRMMHVNNHKKPTMTKFLGQHKRRLKQTR